MRRQILICEEAIIEAPLFTATTYKPAYNELRLLLTRGLKQRSEGLSLSPAMPTFSERDRLCELQESRSD